ncbi:uncharacterized protein PAC_07122 [Phialocephala subalpina]|uniref:Uncharacterized protein n=1 Tax=Phialocephala subalpina TaxID=576137 RepID=A0A1L7WWS9_9HELO|nr:uncharacterized protein PAC_07122 [Phialocephala subalpina]
MAHNGGRFGAALKKPWLGASIVCLFIIWISLWALQWNPVTKLADVTHDIVAPTTKTTVFPQTPTFPPFSSRENETAIEDRPLIVYAFFESANARINLKFFIAHALHDAADFLFIFNGETEAMSLLPNATNIRYVHRANDCYDLGSYAAVLVQDDLYKQYNRFIMMNASIRGPFIPYWSDGCWSDRYLSKVTDSVKLVGMTINCIPINHIQSMILATDRIGLEILLFPTEAQIETFRDSLPPYPYVPANHPAYNVPQLEHPGINSCPNEYWHAVSVEVHASALIKAAGYKIDAMMAAFHKSETYEEECEGDMSSPDVLYENSYWGTNIHPFDTIFAKSNRGTNAKVLKTLTEWTDGRGYSSYDVCQSSLSR